MIAKPLVPPFHPLHPTQTRRQQKRGGLMTLAAAFRGPKGGILLCADREWNDAGVSKREINKIYRIHNLEPCEFFLAGSGPETPVLRAYSDIPKSLQKAAADGIDVLANHRDLLETALTEIHQRFAKMLRQWPMSFLIVVAPRAINKVPMLYWTSGPA